MPLDRSTNPAAARVAVVILNYNGKALSERCIRSVLASAYPRKEILLVDNASTDDSVEYLRNRFPDLVVLECGQNRGIAVGRNRGFREAVARGNDYVISLDNDAHVDVGFIEQLVAVASSDPRIGVVGPKTYWDDGSGLLQCTGGHITYTQNVSCERGSGEIDHGQYDRIEPVDYFPGCGFMAAREVFERLDYLDENFPSGHDDTDFCMRAARAGYQVVYVPRAVMWHRGSATIGVYTPEKKYAEAVCSVRLVRKHGTFGESLKYAFFAGFGLIYALAVQTPRGNHRAVFAKARGLWHGLRAPIG